MRFVAIIPARYASTRFPGKPLAMLEGKTIIQRVYERVCPLIKDTFVATDDSRIFDTVRGFGGKAIMTRSNHRSGTDRCWEAVMKIGPENYDAVINVQGDEPFIRSEQIKVLQDCFDKPNTQIATLAKAYDENATIDSLSNPNSPKVVVNKQGQALYFSRSIIPYLRGVEPIEWTNKHTFFKHLGIYAYRTDILQEITQLEQSELEKAESLEQLRWLDNGYTIQVGITNQETIGIDTPDDLKRAEEFLKKEHFPSL